MKTKVLLTTAALSVAFAACTSEDIIDQNANVVANDRKAVGELAINPLISPESRLHLDGSGFVFDKNDKLGACLMDEITSVYNDVPTPLWKNRFNLVDYIQTNYKFNWTGTKFQSDALLVEGNYFFYFPYDASMVKRNAFHKVLSSEQTFTVGNPRKTVLDNQVFIGHKAVTADKQGDIESLDIDMKAAHAYPAFRLNYSDTKEIQIKKVALKVAQHATDGTEGKAGVFNTMLVVDPTGCTFNGTTIDGSYYSTTDAATAEQISLAIPNVKMTANSQLAGYIVVPAGKYSKEGDAAKNIHPAMWMYIYTNKGLVKTYLDVKNPEQEPAGTPSDNVWTKADYSDFQANNGMLMEVGFSYDAISTPSDFVVSTTEDFELFMEWQKEQTVATTLNAKIVGNDVVLSKKIMDVLSNKNLTLNIYAEADAVLTIPAGVPANAFDRINLTSGDITVVNNADLTIAENYANGSYVPELFKNYGSVTFKYQENKLGEIINYGTITFNKTKNDTQCPSQSNTDAAITNKYGATINVEKNTTIGGTIENEGEVNLSAGMVLNAKINNTTVVYGQVAVINVNGKWNAEGTNKGEINVYGSMIAGTAGYENTEAIVWNNNRSACNEAVINNEGSIKMIENNGNVVMVNADAMYDTYAVADSPEGYIDNSVCSTGIVANEAETIYVKVTENKTASYVNSLVEDAAAEQVRFIGAQTLTVDKITNKDDDVISNVLTVNEIIINGNLNIVGGTSPLQLKSSVVNVNSGIVTLAAKTHVVVIGGLDMTLAGGTKLDIRTSAQLQALGEFNIYGTGTILNQGKYVPAATNQTFVAPTIKQEGKGISSASTYVWNGVKSTTAPTTNANGEYQIASAADFSYFEGYNETGDLKIKLMTDVDMAGYDFTSIQAYYSGANNIVIDGNGHTIYNLKLEGKDADTFGCNQIGLVNATGSNDVVTIKDLTIDGLTVSDENAVYVGALIGYNSGDTEISNVTVKNSNLKGESEVGGLIGMANGNKPQATLNLNNCKVIASTIEAVLPKADLTLESASGAPAGGLVGFIAGRKVTISDCSFSGTVKAGTGFKGNIVGTIFNDVTDFKVNGEAYDYKYGKTANESNYGDYYLGF